MTNNTLIDIETINQACAQLDEYAESTWFKGENKVNDFITDHTEDGDKNYTDEDLEAVFKPFSNRYSAIHETRRKLQAMKERMRTTKI